ncbi:hypothetical protein E2320_016117 [Naja naja]|nr:hypothetical protein E2320_016117 [Naja naja]
MTEEKSFPFRDHVNGKKKSQISNYKSPSRFWKHPQATEAFKIINSLRLWGQERRIKSENEHLNVTLSSSQLERQRGG